MSVQTNSISLEIWIWKLEIEMKTTRTFEQIVTDVTMMRQAMLIREWLCEISGYIPRLNEGPNCYYGSTVDGLVLIEYYGSPCSIGMPFGKWAATGGGSQKAEWFPEAFKRLGLVEVMVEVRNDNGCYGPIWSISKDLEGKPVVPCDFREPSINIVGISSQSAFMQGILLKDFVAAMDARGFVPEELGEGKSPWTVLHNNYYEFNKVVWKEMKDKLGFVEWDDNKEKSK